MAPASIVIYQQSVLHLLSGSGTQMTWLEDPLPWLKLWLCPA